MSFLKSKHSGWTHELKRTPFGGGNPISAVTDTISGALGTAGGGGGLLGGIEDLGQGIGSGLAELDKGVNQIPGGWYTVGGLAAGGTALAFAPEIAAAIGAEAGTQITTAAGQQAFFDTLAAGGTGAEAASAGLSADAIAAASGTGAGLTYTPGADSVLAGENALTGSSGYAGTGLNPAIPSNVFVGDGTLGTQFGTTYQLGANGLPATDLLGNPITASSIGIDGFAPSSGLSAANIAVNANRLKNIAKILTGTEQISKVNATGNLPTAQQWTNQALMNQPIKEQFGGLYEMNKNPFTFQNPLANALADKNKQPGMYDVSGTQGMALNTQQQAANLAKLLA